jgi:tetratricopeptide (TPR) repeat protein
VQLALLEPERRAIAERPAAIASLLAGWAALVAARFGVQAALHLEPLTHVGAFDVVRASPLVAASFGQIVIPVNAALLGVSADAPVARGVLVAVALVLLASRLSGVRWRVVVLGALSEVLLALPPAVVPGTLVLGQRLVLPACGVILLLAEIGRASVRDRAAGIAFSAAGIAGLAALAVGDEAAFSDRRRFARAAVDAAPHSALAHFCLGQSYQIDGDGDRALAEYRMALRLGAVDVVHNNIAVIHMASARWSDAERELREEIARNPRYARAYENLSVVLRHEDRVVDANDAAERARALAGAE